MLIVNTKTVLKNKLKQIVHGKCINIRLIYTSDTRQSTHEIIIILRTILLLSRCLYILDVNKRLIQENYLIKLL